MSMTQTPIILKVEYVSDSHIGMLRRITGFVKMRNLISLITDENLEANPRHSKRSGITKDILETLSTNPGMMPFYSKGLLIGSSEVLDRERHRFQLEFADRQREGVLDGGHNLLAIGITLLHEADVPEKEIDKVKVWSDLKECWNRHLKSVEALRSQPSTPTLDALIPVEIVSPSEYSAESGNPSTFNDAILGICANRNQNAQLAAEAVANQSGTFDALKKALPDELSKAVAWRTNDKGHLDPRFLVALSWVTLGAVPTLSDYGVQPLAPTTAYSYKAEALNRFSTLMKSDGATRRTANGTGLEIVDSYIESAIEMVNQVLQCYDLIFKGYRSAYNANNGAFGRISAVKKTSKRKNKTMFSQEEVSHEVPPVGFMMPVVFSMQALIKIDESSGTIKWLTDPVEFYGDPENLNQLIGALKPIIEMADWDPQKVGKGSASYNSVREKARNLVLESMFG